MKKQYTGRRGLPKKGGGGLDIFADLRGLGKNEGGVFEGS